MAKQDDLREKTQNDVLETAKQYERLARLRLLRMNIIAAGLEVRGGAARDKPAHRAETVTDELGAIGDSDAGTLIAGSS